MLPEEADAEVRADLHGNDPLLEGHPGTPRHKVKGHDRVLPPKEAQEDPRAIRISDLYPDPAWDPIPAQPRVIPVREHLRRNPRHKEHAMTSIDHEPETRTEVTAAKDAQAVAATFPAGIAQARASDPATSHQAAKEATLSLRRRMADVLQTFQWVATSFAKTTEGDPGLTDEDLQDAFHRYGFKGSPSGVRTARKDLCRAGLLEPKMIGEIEDTRPTALGNAAIVYVLTDAGAAFDQAPYE